MALLAIAGLAIPTIFSYLNYRRLVNQDKKLDTQAVKTQEITVKVDGRFDAALDMIKGQGDLIKGLQAGMTQINDKTIEAIAHGGSLAALAALNAIQQVSTATAVPPPPVSAVLTPDDKVALTSKIAADAAATAAAALTDSAPTQEAP